jgi:transposase
MRQQLSHRLHQAYASGSLRRVKRLPARLALADGLTVSEAADLLAVGEQTVRDYRHQFLWKGVASLVSKRPAGRPSTLTKTPRQELTHLITAGPHTSGYPSGCWTTPMLHDLIERRCGVEYHPHSLCPVLPNLGFASQQARCVSDHLREAKRLEWRHIRWPRIVRHARQRKALLLCGAAASFAQWGSLRSTWAPTGQQPAVPTSGTRQAYKVFGLLDSCSGRFVYQAHTGRFHSASSAAFLLEVLAHTPCPVVVMQDGARYHTSKALQEFFATPTARLTIAQLPAYAPDCKPIEPLWKQGKKAATHLQHFPEFTQWQAAVERVFIHFAQTPPEITVFMARYCASLGAMAA